MANLPACVGFVVCLFLDIWIWHGFVFPYRLKALERKSSWGRASLGTQNKVTVPTGRQCRVMRSCARAGESLSPAASRRKQRWWACVTSSIRSVFVLHPWMEHRERRLLAHVLFPLPHTHSWPYAGSSLATAVTFSERQERFWFPFCKIDRNLSVLWEAVLHLSPRYPWTHSTLLKIVQSVTMSSLNCDPTSSALFDSPFLWKYSSFPS